MLSGCITQEECSEVLKSSSIGSRRILIKLSRVRADIILGFLFTTVVTKVFKYLRLRILSHLQTCSFGQNLQLNHHISEGVMVQDVRIEKYQVRHPCKRQEFFPVIASCLSVCLVCHISAFYATLYYSHDPKNSICIYVFKHLFLHARVPRSGRLHLHTDGMFMRPSRRHLSTQEQSCPATVTFHSTRSLNRM